MYFCTFPEHGLLQFQWIILSLFRWPCHYKLYLCMPSDFFSELVVIVFVCRTMAIVPCCLCILSWILKQRHCQEWGPVVFNHNSQWLDTFLALLHFHHLREPLKLKFPFNNKAVQPAPFNCPCAMAICS